MRRSLRAIALTACVASAGTLHAFQRETTDDPDCTEAIGVNCPHRGVPLVWRTFPVRYVINSSGSGLSFDAARDAIMAAFDSWQSASEGGITFEFGGQSAGGHDGQDGQDTISWRSLGQNSADTFSQSIITYDTNSGEIFDVDIELNSSFLFAVLPSGQNDPFDPRADLQAVTTHEVGHLLGLAHENRFGSQIVMFFRDTSGNTGHRTLTADDRDGVLASYTQSAGSGGGGGGGGCAVGPVARDIELWPVLALLAFLSLQSWAKRRPARRGCRNRS